MEMLTETTVKLMRCPRRDQRLRVWRDVRVRCGRRERVALHQAGLRRFLKLSLEGVLGAGAGLGKIAVGAVLHGIGITMTKLVFHGIVSALFVVIRLLGAFAAVGIIA